MDNSESKLTDQRLAAMMETQTDNGVSLRIAYQQGRNSSPRDRKRSARVTNSRA